MGKFFILIAFILFVFTNINGQTHEAVAEIATLSKKQILAEPKDWAAKDLTTPSVSEKPKPVVGNFIYYAFAIAEPNLTMDEYLDGSVVSESNAYMIAYTSHPLVEVISTLIQKPLPCFEIAENVSETMKKEIGILYKNTNIKPAEAQKIILNQITNIYNLRIQTVQKMKEVWLLKVSDSQKYATWTHNGSLTVTETEPSSVNLDDKGFYKGNGNTLDVLAEGLQQYCNELFVAEMTIKAQINIEKLNIKDKDILVKTLLDKYGITMKKVKKMVSVVEISSK